MIYITYATRHVLVEADDDIKFYNTVFSIAKSERKVCDTCNLVFASVHTKDKSGGKGKVTSILDIFKNNEIEVKILGLVDSDDPKTNDKLSNRVFYGQRYCIENYLLDPINIFATLLGLDWVSNLDFSEDIGCKDVHKIFNLSKTDLQKIVDYITAEIDKNNNLEGKSEKRLDDFEGSCLVSYINGKELKIPNLYIKSKKEDSLRKLRTSLKETKMLPLELVESLKSIQEFKI